MIQNVNRRRRILTIIACGLVALFVALMFSLQHKDTVPLSEIEGLHEALIHDGFKMDQSLMTVDEMMVSRIPGVRSVVSAFYPDFRKQRMNRSYSREGAKLGFDYDVRGEHALNVSLSSDAVHCARARAMARELSAANPNVTIWIRTNESPIATKR